jgi:hypothetical protein
VSLDNVTDLLAAIDRLPEPDRAAAVARVEAALAGPAAAARAALGVLALDLADGLPATTNDARALRSA